MNVRSCAMITGLAGGLMALSVNPALAGDEVTVDHASVSPGTKVTVKGEEVLLYGGEGSGLEPGADFRAVLASTDLQVPLEDRVTLVSIVPSLDTPVCEMQTYRLSTMDNIDPAVDVITISRDLPMAQERFAREHDMAKENFVSDYKSGSFGKSAGLMMRGKELLARAVLVLDADGIIRHLQIVPEVSHLPDLEAAVAAANALAEQMP